MIRNKYKLSICIPTYNRSKSLNNLLTSIVAASKNFNFSFQVCISDNDSDDNTEIVINNFQNRLPLIYSKNIRNLGLAQNIINAADLAKGEWVWLIGDDDILLPYSSIQLNKLMSPTLNDVDFILSNCYKLESFDYLNSHNLLKNNVFLGNLDRNSKIDNYKKLDFIQLVNHKYTFDFLGGIFLSIFKNSYWKFGRANITEDLISSSAFTTIENTFPHVGVFLEAFPGKNALFNPNPLLVVTSSEREWAKHFPFIKLIILSDVLFKFKKLGMSYFQYYLNMNSLHKNFIVMFYLLVKELNLNIKNLKLLIYIFFRSLFFVQTYVSIILSPLLVLKLHTR